MKKTIILMLSVLTVLSLFGCTKNVKWNGQSEIFADLLLVNDISDGYVYVGVVDYVFVGTVTKAEGKVIPKKADHEDTFSTFDIKVDINLKGELDGTVTAKKMGGYKSDGTMLLVNAETPLGENIPDTGLPEEGKQYIFLAYAQNDGSLTLSEIFDNRECSDALIEEYREYVMNEVPHERERFHSTYEKKASN